MYQGKIVEQGNAKQLFISPKNNYTKALINSKPSLTQRLKKLPTVNDFIELTIQNEVYSAQERTEFHQKIPKKNGGLLNW